MNSLNLLSYFSYYSEQQNIELPEFGRYATGILFLDKNTHKKAEAAFEKLAKECNLRVRLLLFVDRFQCLNYRVVLCVLRRLAYS